MPDYLYCPAEHIEYCKSVKVCRISDLINQYNIPVPPSIPDHSIIIAKFDTSCNVNYLYQPNNTQQTFPDLNCKVPPKNKNIRKIKKDFLCSPDVLNEIEWTISRIETSIINQNKLNELYTDLKNIFTKQISSLPDRSSKYKNENKKRRRAQPFWNDELKQLWNDRCIKEKVYCSFKCTSNKFLSHKSSLRNDFKVAQKLFDKSYRFYQRKHRKDTFQSFDDLDKTNRNQVWEKLNSLAQTKSKQVIMEIIRDDGSISCDLKEVLAKWHNYFSKSFSGLQ